MEKYIQHFNPTQLTLLHIRFSFQCLLSVGLRSCAYCQKPSGKSMHSRKNKYTHHVSNFPRDRMNLKYPIYFSQGLAEKVNTSYLFDVFFRIISHQANHYYKLFITWTNQKIRNTFVQRNMFEFKHIKVRSITTPGAVSFIGRPPQPFDRSYIDQPGPMVVFATPGMLHAGLSLQIFKRWADDENNMASHYNYIPQSCVDSVQILYCYLPTSYLLYFLW